jgi:hypothetical protein
MATCPPFAVAGESNLEVLTPLQMERNSMDSQKNRKGNLPSSDIVQAARARLSASPYPTIQKLTCECDEQGVLFLRGRLTSFYQKQLAQEAVARMPGMTRLVNEAEVVVSLA